MTLRVLLPALLCALASPSLWAQSITVNVSGSVVQPACTPNIQQGLVPGGAVSGNTVTLPPVFTTALSSPGQTAGHTQITFRAYGCTGNVNNMWVHFTSNSVVSGRIVSSNPQVHFLVRNNNSSGAQVWVGGYAGNAPNANQGTAVPFSGSYPTNSYREANKSYNISYYAQSQVTNAGTFSASVTATFKYY